MIFNRNLLYFFSCVFYVFFHLLLIHWVSRKTNQIHIKVFVRERAHLLKVLPMLNHQQLMMFAFDFHHLLQLFVFFLFSSFQVWILPMLKIPQAIAKRFEFENNKIRLIPLMRFTFETGGAALTSQSISRQFFGVCSVGLPNLPKIPSLIINFFFDA